MCSTPWLTVLIAVRFGENGEALLRKTLHSLSVADGLRAESQVLVVDNHDAPNEKLQALLTEFAFLNLDYLHVPTPGLGRAQNQGVARVTTPWIAFLDADETVPAHWLTAYKQTLKDKGWHPDTVLFGPCSPKLPHRPTWLSPNLEWLFGGHSQSGENLAKSASRPLRQMFGGNMLINRHVLVENQGISEVLPRGMDTDLAWRLECQNKYEGLFVPAAFIYHHITPSRLTLAYLKRLQYTMSYFKTLLLLHHFYPEPSLRARLSLSRSHLRRWLLKIKHSWTQPALTFHQRHAETQVWAQGIKGGLHMLLWGYRTWIPRLRSEGLPRCTEIQRQRSHGGDNQVGP